MPKPFDDKLLSILALEFAYQYAKGWKNAKGQDKPILTARQWAKANKDSFMQDAKRVLYGKGKHENKNVSVS